MDKLASWCLWLRRRSFFRVAQRTFSTLMPIALVGAFFQFLRDSIFSPESFIYNVFDFDRIMSDSVWDIGTNLSNSVVQVVFSIFGIYVVYFSAVYTARLYNKDSTMAGISATVSLLVMSYLTQLGLTGRVSLFDSIFLNSHYILIALTVGYIVGQIFHWLAIDYEPVDYEHTRMVQKRSLLALKPILVNTLFFVVVGGILYWFAEEFNANRSFMSLLTTVENSNSLITTALATILSSISTWAGISWPIYVLSNMSVSAAATANLNYVLRGGSIWNIPYKYLGSSLIYSYGIMGDFSILLALLLAILIWGRRRESETVAKLNIIPQLFGSSSGFLVGLPIILNPIFILPLIIIPGINMLLAALFISLNLIPTPVYHVLTGTPGPLIAFFATNGNWQTLVFSILLFILDALLTIPAVKLDNRINILLKKYEQEDLKYVKKS